MKRDFLSMESWGQEQCLALLDLADRVKRGEISGGLEKKIMAMVFMDPSLRTRASFEAAMFLHGGHGIVLEPGKGSWSLETEPGAVMDGTTVEHIKDAARVLGTVRRRARRAHLPAPRQLGHGATGPGDQALRGVLREADHQPRIHAPAPVPGAGRRDDAAREVRRRPARQALRAHVGVASQGAAHCGARERRHFGGDARHGGGHCATG